MDRFDDLVVFVEVVDSGSLTVAADRLGLSASAVSRRVSQLEDRLGARLFNRTTRRLSLTDVGATFCHRARTILTALDDAERAVGEMGQEPRGPLRIAAPVLFGQTVLAPRLPAFAARYPKVAIDVALGDRVAGTQDGSFDIVVRTGRLGDSAMIARRLAPYRQCVLGSPAYLARAGAPAVPSDLAGHDCLVLTAGGARLDWDFAVGSARETVRVGGGFQADDGAVLKAAALAGRGLVRLPSFAAAAELAAGTLVPVLTDYEVRDASVHVLYPPARHLAPKVRAFVDHLVATLGQPAQWVAAGLAPPDPAA